MASVSSLDKDLRNMRLSRYTPQASKEVRDWIEDVLGEKLAPGDLLEALKDGVALCKLVNLATSPGVKYKQSNMPFVQMENISHFLRAIQAPPLSLPPHDVFLTVDLYEAKDPAQVLQCIGAFSRVANVAQPSRFPKPIGPKSAGPRAGMSPQTTGASNGRSRGISNASQGSFGGRPISPTRSDVAASPVRPGSGLNSPKGPVSSWSKKTDEFNTAPAWNIHQYGYMGGASQGNQGIAFGARRQITSPAPAVPSIAEKERKRKEEEAEKERLRVQAEEAEQRRRVEREAEEERARAEEERRWQEETRRQREQEKKALEEEKRRWEEEERLWREEEEKREREEKEAQLRMKNAPPSQSRGGDARLNGQFLSTYQSSQGRISRDTSAEDLERQAERDRIRELERQLQQAKERESRYQQERQGRSPSISQDENTSPPPAIIPTQAPSAGVRTIPDPPTNDAAWEEDERAYLQREWATHNTSPPTARPLPSRPLPDPTTYKSPTATHVSRTDRFLADNPAPAAAAPRSHFPSELGLTSSSERDAEDSRRVASQTKTRAGGWASSSLLEREMERERERQREWEADQERLKSTGGTRIDGEGVGPGESWDVNQYGYMGGDSQNRGSRGVNFGGRRQIIGPRPPK